MISRHPANLQMRRSQSIGQLADDQPHARQLQAVDASIVSFASVRNGAATSEPSFGFWQEAEEQAANKLTFPPEIVPAMIEVSRGSPNKYEVEKETGQLTLDRVLHTSVYYPGDYGYVPQTLCGDGDPLDILIVTTAESGMSEGLDPGVMVNCRVVGLMDMEDESGHDEKLIAVIAAQRSTDHVKDLDDVPEHTRREIKHFFENYKVLEMKKGKPKWAKVLGWGNRAKALEVVQTSRGTYAKKYGAGDQGKLHPFVRVAQCPNLLHVKQVFTGSAPSEVTCYISAAKGCRNSYAYRQDTTYRHYKYTLDMPYPGDYGWICQTWQSDMRKPIEVLILSTFPLSPECLVDVRIIGALERQLKRVCSPAPTTDIKVIAVLVEDPRTDHLQTLSDLNPQAVSHFSHFFVHSAEMAQCSDCKILRTLQAPEARAVVLQGYDVYKKEFPDAVIHNAANLWCLPWSKEATVGEPADRIYPAIVEAAKHTSNSYSFFPESGVLKCSGPLKTATFWPANAGFIPQTVAEDGRPVDVMILSTLPLESRCTVEIRIVGAIECIDEMGPDIKILGVPKSEPRMKEWTSVETVPKHMKDEMVHFFNSYKDLDQDWKFCRFERWLSAEDAMRYVQGAHSRFFLFVLPMQRMEKKVAELEAKLARLS